MVYGYFNFICVEHACSIKMPGIIPKYGTFHWKSSNMQAGARFGPSRQDRLRHGMDEGRGTGTGKGKGKGKGKGTGRYEHQSAASEK